jgi:hypothetical protein
LKHLATLGVPPPRNPRDRLQTLRFVRALLFRTLLVAIVAWVLLLLVDGSTWLFVVASICLAALAADVLWLSYRVRRVSAGR